MKINWDNSKYVNLRDWLSSQLVRRNYVVFKETQISKTYKKDSHHIRIIDQRWDPPEIWIGTKEIEKNNIRLGFILEYYLSGQIEMIKKYNRINKSGKLTYDFYTEFLDKYIDQILTINSKDYYEFCKNRTTEINSFANDLN